MTRRARRSSGGSARCSFRKGRAEGYAFRSAPHASTRSACSLVAGSPAGRLIVAQRQAWYSSGPMIFVLGSVQGIGVDVEAFIGHVRLIAAIASCVCLAACPMTLSNDVRPGRLTTPLVGSARTIIVYGLDASRGPLRVGLHRHDPAANQAGRCGTTYAQTPEGTSGTTYFVFDAPPGTYVLDSGLTGSDARAFLIPAGKTTFVGVFAIADEDWSPPFDFDVPPGIALSRDIDAARAALGPDVRLELAEPTPIGQVAMIGFVCVS
jgi:hypothetical protein